MVNVPVTMIRIGSAVTALLAILLLAGLAVPDRVRPFPQDSKTEAVAKSLPPTKPAPPAVTLPPPVEVVLQSGVLIVISKASQQMYVFKDGTPWGSSPVSTGRRGKATPAGVFPILQKRVFHRSNLYSNAPMPHMQRLTWSGIAIHAGYLPGYPASHGCIRLPRTFARSLYGLTKMGETTVVITNQAVASEHIARELALNTPMPRPPGTGPAAAGFAVAPALPRIEPGRFNLFPTQRGLAPVAVGLQTIQLTAAPTAALAEAHWTRLLARHPELSGYRMNVIPAIVGSRQVYRLRVSAPQAHALCANLRSAGVDCFKVS